MSWTRWFCPQEQQEEDPRLRKMRQDEEERRRLGESGCVAISGEYWKIVEEGEKKWQQEQALKRGSRSDVRYIEVRLKMPGFFRQVEHIQLAQLRSLYLRECGIISLEAVVRLKVPNIANLDLRHNHITEIRSLRKMGCRFDHLFLAGNPIVDYSALPGIHFHCRLQTTFVTNFTGKDFAVIHDLGPFFKGEARHVMDHLYIHQISTLAGETRKQALFEK